MENHLMFMQSLCYALHIYFRISAHLPNFEILRLPLVWGFSRHGESYLFIMENYGAHHPPAIVVFLTALARCDAIGVAALAWVGLNVAGIPKGIIMFFFSSLGSQLCRGITCR